MPVKFRLLLGVATRSLVVMAGLAALVAPVGCGRSKTPGTDVPAGTRAASPAPVEDFESLPGALSAAVGPGETAWLEVIRGIEMPTPPASWETNPPTREEVAAFQRQQGAAAAALATRLREFHTKFPTNEHAADAREQEYELLNAAAKAGHTNALAALEAIEKLRLADGGLPEEAKIQVRVEQVERAVARAEAVGDAAGAAAAREKGARALLEAFPERGELAGLLLMAAQDYLKLNQVGKARGLAEELTRSPDPELKGFAEGFLRKLDRIGQPIALRFTALDGREVDLANLRGKVVLIDFWATWCLPCLAEMPRVKAVYDKLHDRGFEIVGISFDEKREDLERYVAREKVPWPQYFEADENQFGREFQIESIPTMWLVDQRGRLHDLNAREGLAGKVEKLLADAP